MKLRFLALAALLLAALPATSSRAAVFFSVNFAPPPLPVYVQPACPVDGYLWNPGYWAYGPYGYYWVPGFWTAPPAVGLLWTPPWWGFANGVYVFHRGYWGPRVGFYGGLNYGYGYFGRGFWGGRWDGNVFRYNTAVTRVNTTVIHSTYVNRNVVRANATRVSFNGGANGVKAAPTAQEKAAAATRRTFATSQQTSRQEIASKNQDLRASVNKGHPKVAAISSPAQTGPQVNAAEQRKTAKLANNVENTRKAETLKRENAARTEALRKEQQSRNAERERQDVRRNAERRQVETRAARERETAAARRRMTERSRRPEVVTPREANNRGGTPGQQQRKKQKSKRDQDSDDRR
jgi:WXXGXW repeat (2 copies)